MKLYSFLNSFISNVFLYNILFLNIQKYILLIAISWKQISVCKSLFHIELAKFEELNRMAGIKLHLLRGKCQGNKCGLLMCKYVLDWEKWGGGVSSSVILPQFLKGGKKSWGNNVSSEISLSNPSSSALLRYAAISHPVPV